jgi:iron complex outermembrane recepter protein
MNPKQYVLWLTLALSLSIVRVVDAQRPVATQEPQDTALARYELPAVVVKVTRARQDPARVPQAVSVLGTSEIQLARRQASADEALRQIPGVFASNRHNPGEGIRLSIRAPYPPFGTRGLHLVQDGVPLTMADGTTPEPNNVTLGSAGLIEVIRGPSSVLYGNSAGGVVSVETEHPPLRPLSIIPEAQIGSHGYRREQLKAGGTGAGVGYLVGLSRIRSEGYRARGQAEVRQANLHAQAALPSGTLVRGVFNLYDMPFGGNSSTLDLATARSDPTSVRPLAVNHGLGKSVTQGQLGVSLEQVVGAGHLVRVNAWGLRRDNLIAVPHRIVDLDRSAAGFRSEYRGEASTALAPLAWIAGLDLSQMADDRREFANLGVAGLALRERIGARQMDQLEEVRSFGPFAQIILTPHPHWSFTGGFRYDRYDFRASDRFQGGGDQSGQRTMSAASPMVGVTYNPVGGLNLYANLATAYQTPTTVELSNRPDGLRGFNQDLQPEYRRSAEAGVRGSLDAWGIRYEVAGYRMSVDSALVKFEDVTERSIYRNAGRSARNGLEVLLSWRPAAVLDARLAYTYQDFRFLRFRPGEQDFSGNVEPGAPPHSVFAGAGILAPFGIRTDVEFRWVDGYPVDDANTAWNWSYRVLDLRMGIDRSWRGVFLRPFAGIDNALDERYNGSALLNAFGGNYFEPAPGRAFYGGLLVAPR